MEKREGKREREIHRQREDVCAREIKRMDFKRLSMPLDNALVLSGVI